MNLIDVNLLLYAYAPEVPQHAAASRWLTSAFSGSAVTLLPWVSILGFIRIATDHRVFEEALSATKAIAIVDSWLARKSVSVIEPGPEHWNVLQHMIVDAQVAGRHITDAHLAALAIEHGATLCTTDRGFARFPGLSTFDPLSER